MRNDAYFVPAVVVALTLSAMGSALAGVTVAQYEFRKGQRTQGTADASIASSITLSEITDTAGQFVYGGFLDGANFEGAGIDLGQVGAYYHFQLEFTITPNQAGTTISLSEFKIPDMEPLVDTGEEDPTWYRVSISAGATELYATPDNFVAQFMPWGKGEEYKVFIGNSFSEAITGVEDRTSALTARFDLWNFGPGANVPDWKESLVATSGVGSDDGVMLVGTVVPVPEPSSAILVSVFLLSALGLRRRK